MRWHPCDFCCRVMAVIVAGSCLWLADFISLLSITVTKQKGNMLVSLHLLEEKQDTKFKEPA